MWQTLYSENSIHKEKIPETENVEDFSQFTQNVIAVSYTHLTLPTNREV